jgi:hypothetical protein
MINLIVILISAIMLALLLVWWRSPAFRVWIEAPKYSMLRQEHLFGDHAAPAQPVNHQFGFKPLEKPGK